ncbi:MAG TPA: ATP phosphoribosyltransferase [Planctomycetota bacterium]|nr:ATP phosphoribosyltransferase [Planctomycetota bacterium]
MSVLKIGLPKGSLQEATFDLFRRAGFELRAGARSYFPTCSDVEVEVILFRAQEISRYVDEGVLDAGITGKDWITENESDVVEVAELVYSKVTTRPARWVLAVPEESPVRSVKDLEGKLIATELVGCTRRWLAAAGVEARVEFSWGATEVKAHLVDAIVEVTETGRSLQAAKLRIVDEVLTSTPRFIANNDAWADAWKRDKIDSIVLLLQGAICAHGKVGIKLNCPKAKLEAVLEKLPALKRPTVSPLWGEDWCAVEVIVDEDVVRQIIPGLKRAGAQGIIEYPLNKVIP